MKETFLFQSVNIKLQISDCKLKEALGKNKSTPKCLAIIKILI